MRTPLLIALTLAVAFAGAAAILARSTGGDVSVVGPREGLYRGSEVGPNLRLPRFTLREWNGIALNTATLNGKVVLVTFLETQCTEACPIIADQIDIGLDRLEERERADVVALAVSTHPGDDTLENVRNFLRNHRVAGDLHYLIGPEEELRPVWRSFYVLSALESGDANTHSASVRIFDREGRWVTTLHPGVDLTPANLAHDVRVALRGQT